MFSSVLYICFSSALCICFSCALGMRRDGAWEHAVMKQRPAGQALLDEAANVCVLMHLGAVQGRTWLQERQRVSPAAQVRDGCHMMPSYPI